MLSDRLLVSEEERVLRITLNRPEVRNATDAETWYLLDEVLADVAERADIDLVVISGTGRDFCAGLDLRQLSGQPASRAEKTMRMVQDSLLRLENLAQVTVAVVQGWALGCGTQLALACDLRLAATDTRFGLPMARFGLMASAQTLQRLVTVLGPALTKEMVFAGRHLPAGEAHQLGLVNRVVPPAELAAAADRLIAGVRAMSPAALRWAKRALALCQPLTISGELPDGVPYFLAPADFRDGLATFLAGHNRTPQRGPERG